MFVIIDEKNGAFKRVKNLNTHEIDFAEWELLRQCPSCGNFYYQFPAISRKDNKTEICPACGVKEAFENIGRI